MYEFVKAYLTRLSSGQLVYSTKVSVVATGLLAGCQITTYNPKRDNNSEQCSVWIDEDLFKENELRANHHVCYIEVDKSGAEWIPTNRTMSVADYQASLQQPVAPQAEPVAVQPPASESAPI